MTVNLNVLKVILGIVALVVTLVLALLGHIPWILATVLFLLSVGVML